MSDVTLDSVTKRYDEELAVDDISFTVADGETLGIVGPSGCGKTTTLRTIAGFERPTDGRVLFDDKDVTYVPPEDRNVGLLFQSYALFNNMSVIENVMFGLKMRDVPKADRRERARTLLEMLDIGDLADRDPRQLSGGQQQRVGLARALAPEPHILLLDEPMTGLDAKLKRQLRPELGRLLDDLDVTTLYVTHDQEEAMAMCDRIAVLNDGVVEQVGTPKEVYDAPANRFVADFIGKTNLIPGVARDGQIDVGFATLGDVTTNGHAEDITVVARPEAFTVGDGSIRGTVLDTFYLGEHLEVRVELPGEREVTVTPTSTKSIRRGDELALNLDQTRVHALDNA